MNERIQQLAEQARVLADQFQEQWKAGPSNEEFFQEKFAELIVAECAEQVKNLQVNDYGISGAEIIREHFGVEE